MMSQAVPTEKMTGKKPANYFVSSLIDAGAPILTYFVMHSLGIPAFASMILGISVAVMTTAMHTFKRKKLDGFGVLVIAEIAVSILLQFLLRDPRLLLLKPCFYTGMASGYLFYTAFGSHPLTYEGSRPMAKQGGPQRTAAYDRIWNDSPAFRALHRMATLGWSAAFLADTLLRGVIVYRYPMGQALWLANVPHFASLVILIGFSALVGKKAKPMVDEQMGIMAEESKR